MKVKLAATPTAKAELETMELKRVERKSMPNHDVGDRQRPGEGEALRRG